MVSLFGAVPHAATTTVKPTAMSHLCNEPLFGLAMILISLA
jgi:hypothetical protein